MNARTYDLKASRFDSVQRLFVAKDSPEVRVGVLPESVTVDLSKIDVKQLRREVQARQADFATSPFDPKGDGLRFYRADVTVWSGFPGAGKTTLLRQFVCQLLAAGRRVFLASLEEDPRELLWRLMCTAAGNLAPNDHQAQWFLDAFGDRLRIWNVLGASTYLDILEAVRALKVEHAVIDSLMALDVSGYDWETQRLFAKCLIGCARMSGTHIHLVAHPRKPIKADQVPEVYEVAGSADLGRLVDNVVFVCRRVDENAKAATTGMKILVRKQRHFTGACPHFEGYFHRDLLQYSVEQFPQHAVRYLPEDAYT